MIIRDFELPDLNKGLLESLGEVWFINEISDKTITDFLSNQNYLMVIEHENQIIGCGTLHLQKKLIRNGGIAGFIEDVVVKEQYRNQSFGGLLVKELINKAKNFDCYKVVLTCFPEKVSFYKKNGFYDESICMRHDLI